MWPAGHGAARIIDYVTNPGKTVMLSGEDISGLHASGAEIAAEKREFVTCLNCSESDAARQFKETAGLWSKITGRDKLSGRTCYHGYQAFRPGETDAGTAHEIGVKLAGRLWGRDHEVVIATHCNTGNFHNHFVLNPVSLADGRKFNNSLRDYHAMRRESDRLCLEYGLSVVEEPSERGRNMAEYMAEKDGMPTYRSLIRDDIDRAVRASVTEREFIARMELMGYDIKIRDDSGRILRYPMLRLPGAERYTGFGKLGGSGYTAEGIRARISKNRSRTVPFPEEERNEAAEYRRKTEPGRKLTGLYGLYIRYCYELHMIRRYPASVKKVSFFMREDLIRLRKLDEQTRLLGENRIEDVSGLESFRRRQMSAADELERRRNDLRNELRRAERASDHEHAELVRSRIKDITSRLREIRSELRLCEGIEARSERMASELDALNIVRAEETREEEEGLEQLLNRRGGTGREDEPGRH